MPKVLITLALIIGFIVLFAYVVIQSKKSGSNTPMTLAVVYAIVAYNVLKGMWKKKE